MIPKKYKNFVTITSIFAIVLGVVVVIGWFLDIPLLKSVSPRYNTMKFNTAIGFIFLGLSLYLLVNSTRKLGYQVAIVLNCIVLIISSLSLLEGLTDYNFGIDQLFVKDFEVIIAKNLYPGRISPVSAFCFFLFSWSLFGIKSEYQVLLKFIQFCLHFITLLSFIVLLGYLLNVSALHSMSFITSMDFHTSIAFFLLSIAASLFNPLLGITRLFTENKIGNIMARKLFLETTIMIIFLTFIRGLLYQYYIVSAEFEIALFAIAFILLSLFLVWQTSNKLNEVDQNKTIAEDNLAKINAFLNATPDPIIIVNEKGVIQLLNSQTQNVLGYSQEELLGQKIEKLIPERFRNNHQDHRHFFFKTPKIRMMGSGMELFCLKHNGEEIPVEVSLSPLKMENEMWVSASIRDITDRRIIQEKLTEFQHFFNNSHDLVCIANTNGYFEIINHKWTEVLGYSQEELLSKPFFDFIHPDDLNNMVKELDQLKSGVVSINFNNRYRTKDGRYLWFDWNSIPDPATKKIYMIARDITERKKTSEKLLESKEALELLTQSLSKKNQILLNFSHITSHNLRSPVVNLNGLLNIYNESDDREFKDSIFLKFEQVIHHLSNTLNDLVEALKVQEDINKEKEMLSFEEVFNRLKEMFAGQIIETQALITADFTQLPSILYPKSYLESILLNLLSNAIKYRSLERAPLIHFESYEQAGRQILTVGDNGLGIDLKKHSHKIFGLNKTFHRNVDAKGFGLFITKTQVEAMGGSISVESEVNVGSIFKIIFN